MLVKKIHVSSCAPEEILTERMREKNYKMSKCTTHGILFLLRFRRERDRDDDVDVENENEKRKQTQTVAVCTHSNTHTHTQRNIQKIKDE